MKMKMIILLTTLMLSLTSFAQKVPRVVFVSPDPIDSKNEFWTITHKNLIQAAKDLKIELEMIYTNSHHSFYIETVRELGKRKRENRPDYFLGLPYKHHEVEILEILKKADIKVMFTNMALLDTKRTEIGYPRGKYKNWIGHFYPDDLQAGKLIALELSKECIKNNKVIAITGDHLSTASSLREKGFTEIAEQKNLDIKQIFAGGWKKSKVLKMFPHIELRYPNICGVLSASDSMAEGVIESTDNKYHVCGIDWTRKGLNLIKEEKLLCSAGGHFLEPSFALVAIFDFHNGIDFKKDIGTTYKTSFNIANKENVNKLLKLLFTSKQVINYKSYTKFYMKKLKYDFRILK